MDREQAREDALKRAIRRRKGRSMQEPKSGMIPRMSMEDKLKMEQRRRLMMKRREPVRGMLIGGQAKLDKNKNGRIDAQDFKILKAEKAKGRGQGLQDEKIKPGKVMKADKGGMGEAKGYKKYLQGLKKAEGSVFRAKYKAKQLATAGGKAALRAAKASRVGKIAAGVAGAALLGKAALEKMYEKRTGKKPFTKREPKRTLVDKKMGGGMMQRPIMASKGKSVKVKCKLGRNKPTKMY